MLYRRGDRGGIVERQVEPLGLVLKGGIWYLVARAATNIRTYRVSRVLEMTVLPERSSGRRTSISPIIGTARRRPTRMPPTMSRSPSGCPRAPGRVRRRSRIEAHGERDARTRSGQSRATSGSRVTFDWIDEAVGAALRLGADVEVLEPAWLRRSIFDSATAIVERYAERSVAAGPV